jgi:hypothetical protein
MAQEGKGGKKTPIADKATLKGGKDKKDGRTKPPKS